MQNFAPDGAEIIEKAQSGQRGTFIPKWGIYPVTFGPLL